MCLMIKLFGIILILGASVGVSAYIIAVEKGKIRRTEVFIRLIDDIFCEIRYTREPILEILKRLAVVEHIEGLPQYVKEKDSFNGEELARVICQKNIDLPASQMVGEFFKRVGEGDLYTEQENYERCRDELLLQTEKMREKYQKMQKLWSAIPLCCGICVVLIIL